VIFSLFAAMGTFAFLARSLPAPDQIVRREGFATKISDRNGKLLYDVYGDKRRTPVQLADIPLSLRQATIAIEDKSFYKHTGFDPLTPFRMAWNIVTKQRVIGGSTLTQQLVKNVLLTNERSLIRKVKEFVLTIQVERKYSKDQILQMYLNEIPYGGTAYGIESAAQTYFNKSSKDLTLPESIVLAGLPQSPTRYSPFAGKAYIDRSQDVIRRMREDEYLDKASADQAMEDVKNLQFSTQSGLLKAPHFIFYVKQQLIERYGEKAVEEGGLHVTTSLDLDLQDIAQAAVSDEIAKVKHLNITNGAAIVIDPVTGQVLTMVGSRGWDDPDYDGKFNVVTQGLRQPGSTIKPVVYLAGLRKGYTASTLLMDTQTSFPGGDKPEYSPVNYDGKFRGPILVREALGNSINVPAVKMLALVGIKDMLQVGYDMGLVTLKPTKETLSRVGLSVALGGGEVHLLDLASAYSAFANGGKKVEPVSILKVVDNQGNVLEEWKPTQFQQVITPAEAFIISSILSDPKAREITFGARSAINVTDRAVAVKTGTTNDKKDNWTIGWTPNIVTGVWVGNNNNTPMKEVASGVTGAAPIWRKIILAGIKTHPKTAFAIPDNIVQLDVDRISGYQGHDNFESKKEYFIRGTEPPGDDPVHKKLKVCKGEGKIATPADIANGNYDEKEYFFFKEEDPFGTDGKNKWQEGILTWLNTQSDSKYHPPTEMCGSIDQVVVSIKEPGNRGQVGNDVRIKVDIASSKKIQIVDFIVDGVKVETLSSSPWETDVHITGNGNHKIEVKAYDEQNHGGASSVEISVNQPWADPTLTPTPGLIPTL
jgi:1A family penicillin-binding protein